MQRLRTKGSNIDPLTIRASMKADPGLNEIGGHAYLAGLAAAAPALPNVRDYARLLQELFARRRLVALSDEIMSGVYAPEPKSVRAQLSAAETALAQIREQHDLEGHSLLTSTDFVRTFTPPDYLWDGILQRGFFYSLTGQTGAGKTAFLLRFMAHVGVGRSFGGRDIQQGPVLMLAGENPDDVRMRWIALSEQFGFAMDEMPVHFKTGVFSIKDELSNLRSEARALGGLVLVVVDTDSAYFSCFGDDENSNTQRADWARTLRTLTALPGSPAVVVACHPVKGATENLLPRGGGSFLAEADGNLTAAKQGNFAALIHWQGKFRGADFEPQPFELVQVTSPRLVTSRGTAIPTVVARPLTEAEHEGRIDAENADLNRLLVAILDEPDGSIAAWAKVLGWHVGKDRKPHKSKVSRLLNMLSKQGLAKNAVGTWTITPLGQKAVQRGPK
jgi:hypothetical protein